MKGTNQLIKDHDDIVKKYKETVEQFNKKLEELIIKIHPYVTPEIIYFEIDGGFDKYLNWIVDVTEGKEENNDKYV